MKKKKAFTLAEVLITLTILGVVAAITVPGILQNQQQSANRTKIRKALATYEHAVEQMRVIQGLQTVSGTTPTSLDGWAKQNHCANARAYFKILKDNGPADTDEDKCIFQAADKLWWNISTMSKPIVALSYKDGDSPDCRTKVDTKEGDACYNKSFYLATEKELDAAKGNAFIVNDPKGVACQAMKYTKILPEDAKCSDGKPHTHPGKCSDDRTMGENWSCEDCFGCSVYAAFPWGDFIVEYDEDSKPFAQYANCENEQTRENCEEYGDAREGATAEKLVRYYSCEEFKEVVGCDDCCK